MDKATRPISCLIADDVRASRELMKSWMSEIGFECETVSNGSDAWSRVVHQRPDLILTDIRMPVGSGLDLLRTVRTDQRFSVQSIPVIVITALKDDLLERIVSELGANAVLEKPLSKLTVQAIVERILKQPHTVVKSSLPDLSTDGPCGRISASLRRLLSDIQPLQLSQDGVFDDIQ